MDKKRPWSTADTESAKAMYLAGEESQAIADKLGRSKGSIDNKLTDIGVRRIQGDGTVNQIIDDQRGDARDIVWTTSTPVRTEAEALEKAEIDRSVWEVERCLINSWESASKNSEGFVVKTPLWQVKLWLKKKKGWSPGELRTQLIDALRTEIPRPKVRKVRQPDGGLLLEISIMDHHFGKLAWAPESGENYDLKIAEERYMKAARELLEYAREVKPSLIVVVVGNDFYHVDRGGDNTTTRGTPQDTDGRWQKAYIGGARCVISLIDEAAKICPVRVIVVVGNHDEEKAFTLGVMLEVLYERNGRVDVDNAPTLFKAFLWGTTLLIFYHGHNMTRKRLENLPHEIQDRYPELYAKARWREIHTGHIHSEHERVWCYRTSESFGKTIHRVISSLCGTDKWHDSMGYRSLGAAEAHLYDSKRGRLGYRVSTNMVA